MFSLMVAVLSVLYTASRPSRPEWGHARIYSPPGALSAMNQHCFLCRFNNNRDAVEMHQFIQENIGTMHVDTLAREVHAELVHRQEPMDDTCGESIRVEIIREHITTHTLNPVVRVGMMLRELLDLKDQMRGDLHKTDANGQHLGLDPKMIDAYLRVQGHILNVYKSEPTKMLFVPAASS